MRFSADLGFLWADWPLPDAVRAAKAAGFDAVECHWLYATPVADFRAALDETGLPMMGFNTSRGDVTGGENGLSALPGREAEARAAIDEALAYAAATGAGKVHVMAGFASGPEARATFVAILGYACGRAATQKITILTEPLNRHDAPGYFLQTTNQARGIIEDVDAPNLKLMFDCYHVGRSEGDLITRLRELRHIVGHIQFAAVPDRGAPDHGEIDYAHIFAEIAAMGWDMPLGAEYRPRANTDAMIGWLRKARAA